MHIGRTAATILIPRAIEIICNKDAEHGLHDDFSGLILMASFALAGSGRAQTISYGDAITVLAKTAAQTS
ncbi:hypothetical protein MES4922_30467 [Mesorhizobium ventifaucium]|uniref:Uncharacterized protein n=1 Tax=Mesorhizobium ventifaucium TaxID=666020 RepID=A0ABM9DZ64_9HYPH|nr:hypothetical protein MES4922_30467 [Mesorhizobium ventifaucium]